MTYLRANREYWLDNETDAISVDHPVFRFYGRILRHDFPQFLEGRLLEFGCGQGAAVDYFARRGHDVIGVDVSRRAIDVAKTRYPHIRDRFHVCGESPRDVPFYGHEEGVQVVTAIQALYYFTDDDLQECLRRIADAMVPGGVIFATMMGVESREFYDGSVDAGNGLRRVRFENDRMNVKDYYISFVESEAHLISKFPMFDPIHIGYYCAKFREDEGDGFHRTFCGIKR